VGFFVVLYFLFVGGGGGRGNCPLGFPLALLQHLYFIVIGMPSYNVAAFDQC